MTRAEKVRLLRDRFVHREDTFSIQWFSKQSNEWRFWRVTEGTCPNDPPCPRGKCPHKRDVPLTTQHIEQHIAGSKTLGVYQLDNNDTVKWLCLDVDVNKDAAATSSLSADALHAWVRQHTRKLAQAAQRYRLPFLVEFSGSKGYHLWFFFAEPVPAREAMALGRFLDAQVEPPHFLHTEVFPKQTGQRSFGNLVKLPLGKHQKTGNRCLFVDRNFEPVDDQWGALARVRAITSDELADFLEEHDVPIPDSIRVMGAGGSGRFGLPCLRAIMEQGVGQGSRDEAAFVLGCLFRNAEIPREMALAALVEWNAKNQPPMDQGTLGVKIQSAYSGGYSHFPCQRPLLDPFCDPTCRFYAEKMRTREQRSTPRRR